MLVSEQQQQQQQLNKTTTPVRSSDSLCGASTIIDMVLSLGLTKDGNFDVSNGKTWIGGGRFRRKIRFGSVPSSRYATYTRI